jgi:hypothetical protein
MAVFNYADNFVQNSKAVETLKKWGVDKNRCEALNVENL